MSNGYIDDSSKWKIPRCPCEHPNLPFRKVVRDSQVLDPTYYLTTGVKSKQDRLKSYAAWIPLSHLILFCDAPLHRTGFQHSKRWAPSFKMSQNVSTCFNMSIKWEFLAIPWASRCRPRRNRRSHRSWRARYHLDLGGWTKGFKTVKSEKIGHERLPCTLPLHAIRIQTMQRLSAEF